MNAVLWIIYIAVIVAMIAALWQVFAKAGEAGWKSIIPIWNTLIILKMVGKERRRDHLVDHPDRRLRDLDHRGE